MLKSSDKEVTPTLHCFSWSVMLRNSRRLRPNRSYFINAAQREVVETEAGMGRPVIDNRPKMRYVLHRGSAISKVCMASNFEPADMTSSTF